MLSGPFLKPLIRPQSEGRARRRTDLRVSVCGATTEGEEGARDRKEANHQIEKKKIRAL